MSVFYTPEDNAKNEPLHNLNAALKNGSYEEEGLRVRKDGSSPDIQTVIEVSCKVTKRHFQFKVKDNGIGIAPEYFDKIFIIFQRLHTKDQYAGTGMGLAIAKKIVESTGGKIWVKSKGGKGSAFYFNISK